MAVVNSSIGSSRDLIIHPGDTLAEVIEERGMNQRELAIRTGVTEKHVSTVVHGQKGISAAFARRLEYALGIEASFWMNLQANYERELLEWEDSNSITEEESSVLGRLGDVIELWTSYGWLPSKVATVDMVIALRMQLRVSNLLDVPKISYESPVFPDANDMVDPYKLYGWQRTCEMMKPEDMIDPYDVDKLRASIPDIKHVMFSRKSQIVSKVASILRECGVYFTLVPSIDEVPVLGMIEKMGDGPMIMCVTMKDKYVDRFWSSLFRLITRAVRFRNEILFIDFDPAVVDVEHRADLPACDYLVDSGKYKMFVESGNYKRTSAIEKFAADQNVKSYIVRSMLVSDDLISWKDRPQYDWA